MFLFGGNGQVVKQRKCFLAVGQVVKDGFYIFSVGQVATGVVSLGQVSIGFINIGMIGVGVLFTMVMVGTNFGSIIGFLVAGVASPLAMLSFTLVRSDSTRAFCNISALDFSSVTRGFNTCCCGARRIREHIRKHTRGYERPLHVTVHAPPAPPPPQRPETARPNISPRIHSNPSAPQPSIAQTYYEIPLAVPVATAVEEEVRPQQLLK